MQPVLIAFSNRSSARLQAYQLFKARAYGADAVLLIAAVLPNNDLEYLIAAARKIGLQCLVEVTSFSECWQRNVSSCIQTRICAVCIDCIV